MVDFAPKKAHSAIRFIMWGLRGFGFITNSDVRRIDIRRKHINCITPRMIEKAKRVY